MTLSEKPERIGPPPFRRSKNTIPKLTGRSCSTQFAFR
jgi:hypothetical protein